MSKKGYRKCAWCKEYKKKTKMLKKGKKRFCKGHKRKYYNNHIPTLKKKIQKEFNKFVTKGQKCAWCNKRFEKLDCSHVLSRGSNDHLRFDILNVLPMCSRCHRWRWHDSPMEAMEWFQNTYPKRYDYLMFAKNQSKKWTATELKEIRQAIKEGNTKDLVRFKNEYTKNN